MKRLIIFSFFIILNTMAMRPDFNTRDTEVVRTCKSLNNYIADIYSEMTDKMSVFTTYHSNVEKTMSSLEIIFNNYYSYNCKICKVFADFIESDSFEFAFSLFSDLRNKSEDLRKELKECMLENISLRDLFLDNKEKFDKDCGFIYNLSKKGQVSFSDSDYIIFNSLEGLLERNEKINENLGYLALRSTWIGEALNIVVNDTIKNFYVILEKYKKMNEDICQIESEGLLLNGILRMIMYDSIRFICRFYECEDQYLEYINRQEYGAPENGLNGFGQKD